MADMTQERKDEILTGAAETFYAEKHPDDGVPIVTKVLMIAEVNPTDADDGDTFIMHVYTSSMGVWDAMGFTAYAAEVQRNILETR